MKRYDLNGPMALACLRAARANLVRKLAAAAKARQSLEHARKAVLEAGYSADLCSAIIDDQPSRDDHAELPPW